MPTQTKQTNNEQTNKQKHYPIPLPLCNICSIGVPRYSSDHNMTTFRSVLLVYVILDYKIGCSVGQHIIYACRDCVNLIPAKICQEKKELRIHYHKAPKKVEKDCESQNIAGNIYTISAQIKLKQQKSLSYAMLAGSNAPESDNNVKDLPHFRATRET